MADQYLHGVKVVYIDDAPAYLRTISTAVIGMVCTADDADPAKYPLDTAVLLTDVQDGLDGAGTTGTLRQSLTAIAAHGNVFTVVVRVAEGATPEETTSNVVGSVIDGKRTGMQALLVAETHTSVRPRILGCPGLDTLPVASALATLAEKLEGFAYIHANGCSVLTDAIAYRENFGSDYLMILWPECLAWDGAISSTAKVSPVAYAMGLRAKLDSEVGWHAALSNRLLSGVVGIAEDVSFSMQDPTTDANLLNAADVTTLVNRNGYRFWGLRTTAGPTKTSTKFEPYTRTRSVMRDTVAEGMADYMDQPMTPGLVAHIMDSIQRKLDEWVTGGYLIGGKVEFQSKWNSVGQLADGQLTLIVKYTPVPPLEQLGIRLTFTDEFLIDFANGVISSKTSDAVAI